MARRPEADLSFANGVSIYYECTATGHPGGAKRKAKMSFNDLAKKEAADQKASQEKDPKQQNKTDKSSAPEAESGDPKKT